MKKLSLKLDDLAVDSFVATADEKRADGTVEGYITLAADSCYTCQDTCRSCIDTCPRPCRT